MKRIKLCNLGCNILIAFLISTFIGVTLLILEYIDAFNTGGVKARPSLWIGFFAVLIVLEFCLFWIGIILVYATSSQLGMRYRIWGIILGMIPVAHLIMLGKIICVAKREVKKETEIIRWDEKHNDEQVCATKYPILMVHGVFFRDFEHLNYWGRIPAELKKNGAQIYYGNHNSAASIADSAIELEKRIHEIIEETGADKVNIIAHSKGGLDSRRAISHTSAADYVASLTTINTPHRGCEFADYLLNNIPDSVQKNIAEKYNLAAARLGDTNPDFLAAVYDLTHEKCEQFNQDNLDSPKVYYQSVGSRLNKASGGRFPLNFSYRLVKFFDGENDGLVGEDSFRWGQDYRYLTVSGRRGISHGDMIDLNRENIKEFDVRKFYVELVADLKNRGL